MQDSQAVTRKELIAFEQKMDSRIDKLLTSIHELSTNWNQKFDRVMSSISSNREDYWKGSGKIFFASIGIFVTLFAALMAFVNLISENKALSLKSKIEGKYEKMLNTQEVEIEKIKMFIQERHKIKY